MVGLRRLNEPGEMLLTRIVRGAAIHVGKSEQTTRHAHYAWKLHIGLDAPVWLDSANLSVDIDASARVIVVPPGLEHRVGSVGGACTVLVAPGSHATPWSPTNVTVLDGAHARRLLDACRKCESHPRDHCSDFIAEIVGEVFEPRCANGAIDVRVRRTLRRLGADPELRLAELSTQEGLSLDRLSHLVARDTGTTLRRHALWSRLLRMLSSNRRYPSIAAAAVAGGFADHAHLTRTYRALLGRLPSEFSRPPDSVQSWQAE